MCGMTDGQKSKPMDVFAGDPRSADTDLVIVAAFEGEAAALAGEWSAPTGGEIDRAIASKEFSGKLFETFADADRRSRVSSAAARRDRPWPQERLHGRSRAPRGGGDRPDGPAAERSRASRFVAHGVLESPEMIQAIAEGLTLAEFDAGRYKTAGYDPFELTALGIIVEARAGETAAGVRCTAVASSASTATWRGSSTTSRATR